MRIQVRASASSTSFAAERGIADGATVSERSYSIECPSVWTTVQRSIQLPASSGMNGTMTRTPCWRVAASLESPLGDVISTRSTPGGCEYTSTTCSIGAATVDPSAGCIDSMTLPWALARGGATRAAQIDPNTSRAMRASDGAIALA